MEARHGSRIERLESSVTSVDDTVKGLSARLEAVEKKLPGSSAAGLDDKRRHTSVLGGWERATRRGTILSEVEEALRGLELLQFTDTKPFTTGPRRSIALLPFETRPASPSPARRNVCSRSFQVSWTASSKPPRVRSCGPMSVKPSNSVRSEATVPGSNERLLASRRTSPPNSTWNMRPGVPG